MNDHESNGGAADVLLAGGGLASGLAALCLGARRPDLRLLMLERDQEIGGRHTWSFHATDVPEGSRGWLDPAVAHRWDEQEVHFPAFRRTLRAGYRSLTDASLRDALARLPNLAVRTDADVAELDGTGATLADGTRLEASLVLDGRGFQPSPHLVAGWQKFIGVTFDVEGGHGLTRPVIMDATVPQVDGYRFVYLLPFSDTRVLVEDTRYSDGPELETQAFSAAIDDYVRRQGWGRAVGVGREAGVLPIALAFDAPAFWREVPADAAVPIGMRAALFHPVTGYSLPEAVRLAETIAATDPPDTRTVMAGVRAHALARAKDQRFLRFLSRMLFKGAAPDERQAVLQHFYRLSDGLIERFYAGRTTRRDALRILVGKPPIPIRRALGALPERPLLATSPA